MVYLLSCLLLVWGCSTSPATNQATAKLVYVTVTPAATTPLDLTEGAIDLSQLEGGWGGEFKFEDQAQWTLIVTEFIAEGSGLTVLVTFPLDESLAAETGTVDLGLVDEVVVIRFGIPFQLAGQQAPLTFDGQLVGDKIIGSVRHGNHSGQFELAPLLDFGPGGFKGRT